MRKTAITILFVVSACGAGATATSPHDTLEGVPEAAASALRRQAGAATIAKVSREHAGGRELYEGSWMADGLEREAKVTADGELVELEEEVASAQVPPLVRAAATGHLPGAVGIKFVKLMSGNYEAEVIVEGREHEVTITPDGRLVAGDDDGDDGDEDHEHEGDDSD